MADSGRGWTRRNALRAVGVAVVGGTVASGTTGVATGQGGESWPQLGYDDARSGHASGNTGPGDAFAAVRRIELGGWVRMPPAVVDGTVFASRSVGGNPSAGALYALDARSETERWRFEPGDSVDAPPVVTDGTVYVGSGDGHLYALAAESGQERWRFRTGDRVDSAPAVSDGGVYLGSTDGTVYALAADSGTERWRFGTDGTVFSSPAVVDGTVYVGSSDHSVYAVDAESGEQRWRFRTDGRLLSSPAVVDGTVYVGSNDGHLYALDAGSGVERWHFRTDGKVQSSPAVANGTVYVGSRGSNVYAVDAESGEQRWRFRTGESRASPAVVDGTVYVGGGNTVYALDATAGTERWRVETDDFVYSSPAVANGTVYVGSNDGNLYVILGETATPTPTSTSTPTSRSGNVSGAGGGRDDAFGDAPTDANAMLPVAGLLGALGAGGGLWYLRRNGDDPDSAPADPSPDDPPPSPPPAVDRQRSDEPGYATAMESLPAQVRGHLEDGLVDGERFVSAVETLGSVRANTWLVLTSDRLVAVDDNLYDVTESTAGDLVRVVFGRTDDGVPRVRLEHEGGAESTHELCAEPAAFARDLLRTRPGLSVDPPPGVGSGSEPSRTPPPDRVGDVLDEAETAAAAGAFDDALDRLDAAIETLDSGAEGALDDLRAERERIADRRDAHEQFADETDRLADRLDALRGRVDDDPEATLADLDDLRDDLAALDSRVADRGFDDLASRIAGLRDRTATVRTAAREGRETDLERELADVRRGVESARDRLDDGAIEAAETQADELIERIEAVRDRASDHGRDVHRHQATALREDLADLRSAVEARRETRDAVSRLRERVETAEDRLESGDPLAALSAFDRVAADTEALADRSDHEDAELRAEIESLAGRCRAGRRAARRRLDRRAVERLDGRLDAVEERLARIRSDLPDTATSRLRSRLDEAASALDAVEATAERTGAADLRQRIGTVRSEVTTCRAGIEARETLDTHRDRVAAAFDRLDEGAYEAAIDRFEAVDDDLADLADRVDGLDVGTLDAAVATLRDRCREGLERTVELVRDRPPRSIPDAPDLDVTYGELERRQLLGKGGNADVYLVETPAGDELAVKEPRVGGTLHVETVDRLMREAETWDKLDGHDHVVGVVDYDAEPMPWIAMEYMDAGDLADRTGAMAFDQALWTAIAITKGVRFAHRRGVAHLDLKPANVLFRDVEDAWDVPKVADWGLSRHLLEHSKSLEGLSPQYAAPEQFDEAYGSTDDMTDVYQLGSVFYDLFVGRPPFEGTATKVMRRVLDEEPTPPSEVADVPPELDEVLLTALAKEKADRYDGVLLLRNALRRLADE
ncbi:PQQ-binding-like beta-propeller repeat protein [Haloplanus halophilus]|uniref:outer membrane protein assembly factor BamB family protein n=1 Tax=Haloplanus halophilus TaxID=2949993 RepID=UPI002041B995|nr:PQQ-binding-like beta-propeller repeat protein [Haloplanus sp. GDY1]